MRQITGYKVIVRRGAHAGRVIDFDANYSGGNVDKARRAAHRRADRLDLEYGAICASVQPVFAEMAVQPS